MRWLLPLLVCAPAAHAECAFEGVEAAQRDLAEGHRVLQAARQRPACRDDPLLLYNLAFVRHELARRDLDRRMACRAARTYRDFLRIETGTEAARLARERLAALDADCEPAEEPAKEEAFPWTTLTLTTGVVAATSALVFGSLALDAAGEARATGSPNRYDALSERSAVYGAVSDVSWSLAAVAGATALVLWLID